MLETVLKGGAADRVLTGGLVGNILLAAKGAEIGKGSLDFIYKSNYGEYIDVAKVLLEKYADRSFCRRIWHGWKMANAAKRQSAAFPQISALWTSAQNRRELPPPDRKLRDRVRQRPHGCL